MKEQKGTILKSVNREGLLEEMTFKLWALKKRYIRIFLYDL